MDSNYIGVKFIINRCFLFSSTCNHTHTHTGWALTTCLRTREPCSAPMNFTCTVYCEYRQEDEKALPKKTTKYFLILYPSVTWHTEVIMHTCNSSIPEVKTKGFKVQGSQGYTSGSRPTQAYMERVPVWQGWAAAISCSFIGQHTETNSNCMQAL